MREDEKPITIRLGRDTWQALRALAKQHERSLNSEVNWALREYVRRSQGGDADEQEGR